MSKIRSKIIACGTYLPEKILTNRDLEKIVDTSDEWIFERTGIKQRHIAAENEFTSGLGYKAALQALKNSNLQAKDIDLVLLATTTPDNIFPSTATKIQHKLGCTNAFAFDLQAVCSGFVYALNVADNFIKSGQVNNVLVIGAETLSRIINWQDRNTCVLFGDGAGAVILSKNEKDDSGIIACKLYSDGSTYDILNTDGGPSLTGGAGQITMQGKEVFKHAVSKMSDAVKSCLKTAGLSEEDLDILIPHQANQRILSGVAKKLKLTEEQVVSTVKNHANTSAASIPLALGVAIKESRIKREDNVIFEALGAGLTWGSILIKW